ncbi:hypothetical protein PoB_001003700 [Plakobranchus ocellatus]|uniref:SMB domain-containing protein n=1 Tax=Plakobranchus ocellatus TaxID=259542 RepID=A0AAV3YMA0_9GAST|nr:hypothetical protein PoB_001003700 [Plakobranchus ocellatus]
MEFFRHQHPKIPVFVLYSVIITSLPLTAVCPFQTDAPNLATNRSRPGTAIVAKTQSNQTVSQDLEIYTTTQGNENSFSIQSFGFQQNLEKSTYREMSNPSSSANTNEGITQESPSPGIHTRTFVKEKGLDPVGCGNTTQISATSVLIGLGDENNSTVSTDLPLKEKSSQKPKDESAYEFRTKPYSNLMTSYPPPISHKSLLLLNLPNKAHKALPENDTSKIETDKEGTGISKVRQPISLTTKTTENNRFLADSLNGSSFVYGQVEENTTLIDDNDIDMTLTFTCEGNCGKKISFPCSCSATCVVYGTCCENLSQDCPHVWKEGQLRFDHIRRSDFVCDADLKIYKIVSCPGSLAHKEIGSSNTETQMMRTETVRNISVDTTPKIENITLPNTLGLTEADKQLQKSLRQRLIKALTAVPVTDSSTGFTFTSKAIYDCLNMPPQTAMPWSLKFDYKTMSPTKLEDVDNFQTLEEYYPNFDKDIFTAHLCAPDIIDTCNLNADLEEQSEIYEDNCKNSTAIVVSKRFRLKRYRNRFCAYCNEGRHSRYYLLKSNRVFVKESNFVLLMSLSQLNTLSFKLITRSSFSRVKFPWSQVECPVPDQISSSTEHNVNWRASESEKPSICSVTCGHPSFTIRSDGICRARHIAYLAVADDGLAPLCPSAMTGMARFFACGLESEIESLRGADVRAPSVEVMFDSTYNKSLYVVKLYMALPEESIMFFSNSGEDVISNTHYVALLAKSFKDYRLSQTLCPEMEKGIQNDYSRIIQTSSLVLTMERLLWKLDYLKNVEQLRGPVVDNQTTTTVCVSTVFQTSGVEDIDPNELKCMDDPVYERDAVWITKFLDSPCLSLFDNLQLRSTNGAICIGDHRIFNGAVLFLVWWKYY